MKLQDKPFQSIKNRIKTIEMRLYDEKRKLIETGDEIVFTNLKSGVNLKAKVKNIFLFRNFQELYNAFDKTKLGYQKNEDASPNDMEIYYPKEEQQSYGVCGIEIEVI